MILIQLEMPTSKRRKEMKNCLTKIPILPLLMIVIKVKVQIQYPPMIVRKTVMKVRNLQTKKYNPKLVIEIPIIMF